jgi:hypothetical protein
MSETESSTKSQNASWWPGYKASLLMTYADCSGGNRRCYGRLVGVILKTEFVKMKLKSEEHCRECKTSSL